MNIKELRIKSGLKAYKIAEFLSISRKQFNNLEKGVNNFSEDKIEKLSELYNVEKEVIKKAIKEGEC